MTEPNPCLSFDVDQNVLYVALLEEDKYYVGNLKKIYSMDNPQWIKDYPIKEIIKLYLNTKPFDDQSITFDMMKKYGIDNVRGGAFLDKILTISEIDMINKIIGNQKNPANIVDPLQTMNLNCIHAKCTRKFTDPEKHKAHIKFCGVRCTRCKRFGHFVDKCQAKTDRNNMLIDSPILPK